MISEDSSDTDDWSNGCWKFLLEKKKKSNIYILEVGID